MSWEEREERDSCNEMINIGNLSHEKKSIECKVWDIRVKEILQYERWKMDEQENKKNISH